MDDAQTLSDMNSRGEYSLRQAIRQYLATDGTRRLIDKWEPTGLFFEKYQLTWRDCFLLSFVFSKYNLLENQEPPYGLMTNMDVYCDDADEHPDGEFEAETEVERSKFDQAFATMRKDSSGHCKFSA